MKLIFGILISSTLLFSGDLIVKDSDTIISINGDQYTLKENEKKSFLDGSTICYIDGAGRVIVNNSIQLTKKKDSCIQTKSNDTNAFKNLLETFKDSLLVSFSNTEEKVLDGVSSKDIDLKNDEKTINLSSSKNYLIIKSDSSGPLPITLEIKDKKGYLIKKIINENDINTAFIIKTDELEDNNIILITNGFGMKVKELKILKKN